MQGDKTLALCDRLCNVVAPFISAPGNKNECPLLKPALASLKKTAKAIGVSLKGVTSSWDGVFDSKANRKAIFNAKMIPNIPENKRNRKKTKRGRKRLYRPEIFEERFETIERLFAWEDKFKRLLLRFERISALHYGMKMIVYSLINLRHFA